MASGRMSHKGRQRAPLPRLPLFLIAVCLTVTIAATAIRAFSGEGESAVADTAGRFMGFLDYFAGVFTLLSLTGAVVCGLTATDRRLLSPRGRLAAQSVHRAMSVGALLFLIAHIAVKIVEQEADPLVPLLPFAGGATLAVGLGTLAADLMVLTAITGMVRGRFADSGRPWLWRPLHCAAYGCWPIALAHGLSAGRPAAVWVLWSYGTCAALVALALLVRVLGAAGQRRSRRLGRRGLRARRAQQPSGGRRAAAAVRATSAVPAMPLASTAAVPELPTTPPRLQAAASRPELEETHQLSAQDLTELTDRLRASAPRAEVWAPGPAPAPPMAAPAAAHTPAPAPVAPPMPDYPYPYQLPDDLAPAAAPPAADGWESYTGYPAAAEEGPSTGAWRRLTDGTPFAGSTPPWNPPAYQEQPHGQTQSYGQAQPHGQPQPQSPAQAEVPAAVPTGEGGWDYRQHPEYWQHPQNPEYGPGGRW